MIVLKSENLTKQELLKLIKDEMKNLNEDLVSQKDLKKRIIAYMRSYICSVDYSETDGFFLLLPQYSTAAENPKRGKRKFTVYSHFRPKSAHGPLLFYACCTGRCQS